MRTTREGVPRTLTTLLLAVTLAACNDNGPVAPEVQPELEPELFLHGGIAEDRRFTVYTRNVYLGGDTGPLLQIDFGNIGQVLAATTTFWDQVTASDPTRRMASIVGDIQRNRPELVGLQEVFHFRVLDFTSGAPVVVRELDLLGDILAEIDRRSLPYELVAVQENTTTGPTSGLPLSVDPEAGAVTSILQFTDRIAMLRRSDVEVTATQGQYGASFAVGPLTLTRGWIRGSTEYRDVPHHFVTTHLETQTLAPVQAAQTDELLGSVVSGLDGVTLLGGDLNSDAAAGPGAPSWTPTYETLVDAGFVDAWEQGGWPAWDEGFTCCQDPDLRNRRSSLEERIDFVLVRLADSPPEDGIPGLLRARVIGDMPWNRVGIERIWSSDHAGLVTSLRLDPPFTWRDR